MKGICRKIKGDKWVIAFVRKNDNGMIIFKNDQLLYGNMIFAGGFDQELLFNKAFDENNPYLLLENDWYRRNIKRMIEQKFTFTVLHDCMREKDLIFLNHFFEAFFKESYQKSEFIKLI